MQESPPSRQSKPNVVFDPNAHDGPSIHNISSHSDSHPPRLSSDTGGSACGESSSEMGQISQLSQVSPPSIMGAVGQVGQMGQIGPYDHQGYDVMMGGHMLHVGSPVQQSQQSSQPQNSHIAHSGHVSHSSNLSPSAAITRYPSPANPIVVHEDDSLELNYPGTKSGRGVPAFPGEGDGSAGGVGIGLGDGGGRASNNGRDEMRRTADDVPGDVSFRRLEQRGQGDIASGRDDGRGSAVERSGTGATGGTSDTGKSNGIDGRMDVERRKSRGGRRHNELSSSLKGSSAAPTALMIMRRRRSNSDSFGGSQGKSNRDDGSNSLPKTSLSRGTSNASGTTSNLRGGSPGKDRDQSCDKDDGISARKLTGDEKTLQQPSNGTNDENKKGENDRATSSSDKAAPPDTQPSATDPNAMAYEAMHRGYGIHPSNAAMMSIPDSAFYPRGGPYPPRFNSSLDAFHMSHPAGVLPSHSGHPLPHQKMGMDMAARGRAHWEQEMESDYYYGAPFFDYYDTPSGGGMPFRVPRGGGDGRDRYEYYSTYYPEAMRGFMPYHYGRGGQDIFQQRRFPPMSPLDGHRHTTDPIDSTEEYDKKVDANTQVPSLKSEEISKNVTTSSESRSSGEMCSSTASENDAQMTPDVNELVNNTKALDVRDWKTDRIWREDDHSRTTNMGTTGKNSASQTVSVSNAHHLVKNDATKPNNPGSPAPQGLIPTDEDYDIMMYSQFMGRVPYPMHMHNNSPHVQHGMYYSHGGPMSPGHHHPNVPHGIRVDSLAHASKPPLQTKSSDGSKPYRRRSSNQSRSSEKARNRKSGARSVTFGHLQIRTYETILGDNPSCSGGPSLGLGWRYDPTHFTSSVDDYERRQIQLYGDYGCRPEDLVLHRFEREAILLNTGYTRHDLAESVRSINKVKNRRRQTVHNLPVAWAEERVEVIRRTLRRLMLKKSRTKHLYEQWKKNERSNPSSGSGPGSSRNGNFKKSNLKKP